MRRAESGERRASRLKPWLRAALAGCAVIVGWVLSAYAADWALVEELYYGCPVCRAGKTVTRYALIPVRIRVRDGEFSRYYLRNADPDHRHTWLGTGVSRTTRTGDISGHGGPDPLRLRHEAALAIIKSLPDQKSRKAFFEQLYVRDESLPDFYRVREAIWKLNDAYWENEHRDDWLSQLRKVGLYPTAGSHGKQ